MKKRLLALLLVICCLCLSSCTMLMDNVMSIVADKAAETGAEALARQFIDGLLSNNPQESHSVFVPGVEMEQVTALFPQMQAMLPDADTYTLTPTHWSTNTSEGVTMHAFQFQLTMETETFIVETLQMSGVEGLYNLNIAPYTPDEASASSVSGEISPVETAFAIVAVLEAIFVIWALVDCCRHKIRRKWLWVLAILLGNVLLLLTLDGSKLNFNLQFGLYLNATAFKLRDGGFYLSVLIPAGSIAYLSRRKHLLVPESQKGFAEAFPKSTPSTGTSDNNKQE